MLIHLNIEQTRYVTLISAMPCGFFGVVFGRGFDSNPKLASSLDRFVPGRRRLTRRMDCDCEPYWLK